MNRAATGLVFAMIVCAGAAKAISAGDIAVPKEILPLSASCISAESRFFWMILRMLDITGCVPAHRHLVDTRKYDPGDLRQ